MIHLTHDTLIEAYSQIVIEYILEEIRLIKMMNFNFIPTSYPLLF